MCDRNLVHVDHAGDTGAETVLVAELWRLQGARWALAALNEEAANLASLL